MSKKVSMNTLNNYLKSVKGDDHITMTYEIDGLTFEVKVKKQLSLPERSTFIDEVIKGCFVGNVYIPEYVSVMKTIMFYRVFTDLPVPSEVGNSDDQKLTQFVNIQKTFDIAVAMKLIANACNTDYEIECLYDELCQCVDNQIEYTKNMKTCAEKVELIELLSRVESMSSWIENAMNNIDVDKLNESLNVINEFDPNIIAKLNRGVE